MRGVNSGIPEPHPVRGPALKSALTRIAEHVVTPTQGLAELNKSDYTAQRAPLKMDKFRVVATDAFYAGVIEMNRQIKAKNEAGMHKPLISLDQHDELVRIFTGRKKNQLGPRKNGNPDYPLNTITMHDTCCELKNGGKLVGFKHSNGKNPNLIYEKYRCRTCGFYITREELHQKTKQVFTSYEMTERGTRDFLDALDIVWRKKEAQAAQDAIRIDQSITNRKQTITNNALAAIEPSNASIKQELLANIESMKVEVKELEAELAILSQEADSDRRRFMEFALKFVDNLGDNFFSLTDEDRKKCKQILFPAGFRVDSNKKVYTPEISTLYRLASSKRDTEVSQKASMVRVQGL